MYWIIVRDEVSWHSTRLQMSFNLILLLCGLLYHPFLHTLTSVVVSLSTLHAWVTHLWLQFWFIFLTVFILFFFSNYAAICRCRLLDIYFKPLTHSMQGVDGQCLSGHVLACKLLVVQLCPCMGVFFFFLCPVVAVPYLAWWIGYWVQKHYSIKHKYKGWGKSNISGSVQHELYYCQLHHTLYLCSECLSKQLLRTTWSVHYE